MFQEVLLEKINKLRQGHLIQDVLFVIPVTLSEYINNNCIFITLQR